MIIEDFIKTQARSIRTNIDTLYWYIEAMDNGIEEIIVTNTCNNMSLSEAVGRVASVVAKNIKSKLEEYTLAKAYYWEAALIALITQYIIDTIKVVKKVTRNEDNKFSTTFTVVSEVTELPEVDRNIPSVSLFDDQSIAIKGHRLCDVKAPNFNALHNEVTWKVKDLSDELILSYNFLKYMKNKNGLENQSPIQYKQQLAEESKILKAHRGGGIKYAKSYDSRGRGYPLMRRGITLYGDHFQSRVIEAPEYIVNEKDIEYTMWLAYTDQFGRVPKAEALELYDHKVMMDIKATNEELIANIPNQIEEYKNLKRGEDIEVMLPNELGDMLYFNEMITLIDNGIGVPSRFLAEVDKTNSGLIHLANSTRDPKLMRLANLLDSSKVYDSHTGVADSCKLLGVSLTRNEAKPINTALLHGGGTSAMSKSTGIAEEDIVAMLSETYGVNWSLPNKIAKLGTKLANEGHSVVQWTMPDGFEVSSVSYTTNTKVPVQTSLGKITIHAIMPPLVVKGTMLSGHVEGALKVNGLDANLTHAIDSYYIRETYRRCSFKFVDILDKWKNRPSDIEELFDVQFKLMNEIKDLKSSIMTDIHNKYGSSVAIQQQDNDIVQTNNWLAS